ncbi:hypothetical protein N7540_013206 [Penicillium herquei]|nr:hypothetical protein N7540_013206 [Penicillium herquei]
MTARRYWNPLVLCEMGAGPRGDSSFCCGIADPGRPCKNSIRGKELKAGREDLLRLSLHPVESLDLQRLLIGVAKNFLCRRWHRGRQAESIGKKWYDTAMRNHTSLVSSPVDPQPYTQMSSLSDVESELAPNTSLPDGDMSLQPAENEAVEVSSIETSTFTEESQTTGPYVTTAMVRANDVPWDVSPTRSVVIPSADDIRADVQGLYIANVNLSDEISEIHCTFCLAEDGDEADECVVLRCNGCRSLAHLVCVKQWLEKRGSGFDQSCCVCRNEGALDALIRSRRVSLAAGASEESSTALVDENTLGPVDSDISGPIDGQQHQLQPMITRQSSRRLMDQAVRQGNRWSARLAIQPHDTRAEPRRSERLAERRRR